MSSQSSTEAPPRHLAVEGPIGVGKTSLARRLAESFDAELVLETPEQNPFLERFYQDQRSAALPTQLAFLLQRARVAQTMRQGDMFRPRQVTDFLLDKDRIFARLTLDPDEYRLYEQVYERVSLDAPVPDLVIGLQAPVDVLLTRIAQRAIPYEQSIERAYLQSLSEAYTRFFHNYQAAPLLLVNTAAIDLAGDEHHYQALLKRIRQARRGRQFYNPAAGGML